MMSNRVCNIFLSLTILAGCGGSIEPDDRSSVGHAVSLKADPAASVPDGMVFVPGGRTTIGSKAGLPIEQPEFDIEVQPFYMDSGPVTVAEYRKFVSATGYVTDAEKFGSGGVFDMESRQWLLVSGASWNHPQGPARSAAIEDHPVTQVSWNDALAFAKWAGKRLPTEVEWEHAARGAVNSRARYAWGESLVENGNYKANTWQGSFPEKNTGEDGYQFTSPVGAFGKSSLGLTDMGGNVWEWTSDWLSSYDRNDLRLDQSLPAEKIQRGGSFLCNPSWCHGYRVSGRSHSTPETSLFHVGFRCVKDLAE